MNKGDLFLVHLDLDQRPNEIQLVQQNARQVECKETPSCTGFVPNSPVSPIKVEREPVKEGGDLESDEIHSGFSQR